MIYRLTYTSLLRHAESITVNIFCNYFNLFGTTLIEPVIYHLVVKKKIKMVQGEQGDSEKKLY